MVITTYGTVNFEKLNGALDLLEGHASMTPVEKVAAFQALPPEEQRALEMFQENSFIRGIGYCLYRMLIMSNGDSQTINTLSKELEQISEDLSYSKLPIWLEGSKLLCALENVDIERVWSRVLSLHETRTAVNLGNIHVEDGPIFPWLYAAQYMQRHGHITKLSEILSMIDTELNGRYFHERDELERLREYIL